MWVLTNPLSLLVAHLLRTVEKSKCDHTFFPLTERVTHSAVWLLKTASTKTLTLDFFLEYICISSPFQELLAISQVFLKVGFILSLVTGIAVFFLSAFISALRLADMERNLAELIISCCRMANGWRSPFFPCGSITAPICHPLLALMCESKTCCAY